ncbi:MAG TPA: CoA ester lyase [Steroidobacteraceae bacterium]|nr:CoA ester lyase [Steroidobacteraceae bacterium]
MSVVDGLASLLFVPGSRPDRFGKALASGADAVCIDLEDGVADAAKVQARAAALEALAGRPPRVCLRINGLRTRIGLQDLVELAACGHRPELLLVPKVESAADVEIVSAVTGLSCIVPLIETPRGLAAAAEIATAPAVAAMMFGGGDFAAELGVRVEWEPLRTARGLFILACAQAAKVAIDVPYLALEDPGGLAAEAEAAKAIGFGAKAAIHPAQIAPIHAVLRPTAAEVAEALEAQRAFEAAGGGAIRFKGRLLDEPIMRRYRRVLAMQRNQHA